MPEIMRQFGQTIIVALAGAMLIAGLFVFWPSDSGNVMDDLGQRAGTQILDRSTTGTGTTTFDDHSGRSVPAASVNGPVQRGVELALFDNFTITDADGAVWSNTDGGFVLDGAPLGGLVQIESITSADGTEHVGGLTGQYATDKVELDQATGVATFLEPGVYRVRLRVMDHDNVEATYTIPLVVDFVLEDEEITP